MHEASSLVGQADRLRKLDRHGGTNGLSMVGHALDDVGGERMLGQCNSLGGDSGFFDFDLKKIDDDDEDDGFDFDFDFDDDSI